MFSHLRRLSLRRCLHTQAPRVHSQNTSNRLRLALGTSAAVTSYVIWRLTLDQRIALDSATTVKSSKKPVLDGPSSETPHSHTSSSDAKPETSPDSPKTEAEGDQSTDGASQGAFNPATGEINWDCPCLGGMAHGPCGPEFREAFSCFVFSEEEPKGINCVEKFKAMQTCFRAHPEVYADEIMDDDEEEGQSSPENTASQKTEDSSVTETSASSSPQKSTPATEVSP